MQYVIVYLLIHVCLYHVLQVIWQETLTVFYVLSEYISLSIVTLIIFSLQVLCLLNHGVTLMDRILLKKCKKMYIHVCVLKIESET